MSSSKVVIVTGASRGIGLAVTEYLVRNSHKVVIVSRSQEVLAALKDKYPSQIEYFAADLANFDVRCRLRLQETEESSRGADTHTGRS